MQVAEEEREEEERDNRVLLKKTPDIDWGYDEGWEMGEALLKRLSWLTIGLAVSLVGNVILSILLLVSR